LKNRHVRKLVRFF